MGAFLDKPKLDKHNEVGRGNGLLYGLASMQGWRIEMEDAHCAVTQMPGNLSGWSFFAVFDGHAGARISEICAQQLLSVIINTEEFKRIDPEMAPSINEIREGIRQGFLKLDEQMRQMPEVESGKDKSGSTAICAIVSPEHIYMANCGDSRGLLIRQGNVFFGTRDHKPVNPTEKERIQNAGGNVMIQRVNGSLAVSRSLGDFDYKKVVGKGPTEQLVSPEPEVSVFKRVVSEDEFIVLACDGIWDVMSNEEFNEYLQHRVRVKEDLSVVCNEIMDACLHKGSRDNMSIVVVAFEKAPKVDPVLKEADEKLDDAIRQEIHRYCTKKDPRRLDEIELVCYIDMEIPKLTGFSGFPPGGVVTKRSLIEQELHAIVEQFKEETGDTTPRVNSDAEDEGDRPVYIPKLNGATGNP